MKKFMNTELSAGFALNFVLIALTMAAFILTAGCTSSADSSGNTPVSPSDTAAVTTPAAASAEPVSPDTIKATWVSTNKASKFDNNRYSIEYSFVGDGRGILIFYDNNDKYLFEEPFGWEYAGIDNTSNAQIYKIEFFSKYNGLTDEVRLLADGKTITDSNGIMYKMSKLSQTFA